MDLQLDYLFTAHFEDGTVIEQSPDDSSQLVEGKSSFTDVQAKMEESPLMYMILHGENDFAAAVDLRDGHFEINGVPFYQHRYDLHEQYENFRPIYFRTVQRIFDQSSMEQVQAAITGYTLGWQVTVTDEEGNETNVQRFITI